MLLTKASPIPIQLVNKIKGHPSSCDGSCRRHPSTAFHRLRQTSGSISFNSQRILFSKLLVMWEAPITRSVQQTVVDRSAKHHLPSLCALRSNLITKGATLSHGLALYILQGSSLRFFRSRAIVILRVGDRQCTRLQQITWHLIKASVSLCRGYRHGERHSGVLGM